MKGMRAFDVGMLEDARECFKQVVEELGADAHGTTEKKLVARSQHMRKKITAASSGSADPLHH